jgi:hypothetical protein
MLKTIPNNIQNWWTNSFNRLHCLYETFRERFFMPHPIHLRITDCVSGSGLLTNFTSRKSLMLLRVSIPYLESFPMRTFETSWGHRAQRRNSKPYINKKYWKEKLDIPLMENRNKLQDMHNPSTNIGIWAYRVQYMFASAK